MKPGPNGRTGDVEAVTTPRPAAGSTAVLSNHQPTLVSGQQSAQQPSKALLDQLSPEKRALLEHRRRQARRPAGLPARPTGAAVPLSFAQERMFLLDQLLSDRAVYNAPQATRLRGELDVAALRRALGEIVRRHEVLRTGLLIADSGPVADVRPSAALDFELVDLSGRAPDQAALRALVEAEVRRPFDLSRDDLLRALLLRVGPTDHVLVLTMHHVASDGRSKAVVRDELEALYQAYAAGQPATLPEPSRQYADYAYWQRAEPQADALAGQLDWWREQLSGAPEVCTFPTERPRPAVASGRGAKVRTLVPAEELAGVARIGREQGATLFMTLLAAFAGLIRRYCGVDDVVVGTPITGRHFPETESMIGLFLDTLVLRVDASGDPSFAELVERARETATGAYAHQQVPFDRLVQELRPERDLSRNPLFQVMVTLREEGGRGLRLPGIAAEPVGFDGGSTKFDLTVVCSESARGLEILWQFSTDLFDPDSVARWGDSLRTLLAAAVAEPEMPLSRLPLLSDVERLQVQGFSRGPVREWSAGTVLELIQRRGAADPSAIAATDTVGQSVTYAELELRAEVLAGRLRAAGVKAGDRVGLCVGRSVGVLVSMLATWKAGAAYVPLDAAFPASRLAFMLEDAGVAAVIRQPGVADVLPSGHTCIDVDAAGCTEPAAQARSSQGVAITGADAAYVMYTSGSTGLPKGVIVEHSALVNVVLSMAEEPGFGPHDVFLAVTTFSFDISGLELFVAPVVGGRVVFVDESGVADPYRLAELIEAEGVTVLQATPSTWRMLVQSGWAGAPELRAWCGGEALGTDLAAALVPLVGELWNVYGPTETTIWSTAGRILAGDRVSLGRPIANTTCLVLDPAGSPVPVGVAGELLIGGDGLARGYLARPELTRERFVSHPSDSGHSGTRLYRTGDLARWLPDGSLDYLGRADGQIKLRGHRIELGEVEAALADSPLVKSAAAAVRIDRSGEPLLIGYVVLDAAAGHGPGAGAAQPGGVDSFLEEWREAWEQNLEHRVSGELLRGLASRLPGYMVPGRLMILDELPLTPNGKLDRPALPTPTLRAAGAVIAPRTETERQIAGLYADLLDLPAVGVEDDFFELGGHSLLAMQLFTQIEQRVGVKLPFRLLFEETTVERLARALDEERTRSTAWSPFVALRAQGTGEPLWLAPVQRGDVLPYRLLTQYLAPGRPIYGLECAGLDGRQAPDRSIAAIAAHCLRTVRKVQPVGPYRLGGYCFAGVVAYEMASQLAAEGEYSEVLLLDAVPPWERSFRKRWVAKFRKLRGVDMQQRLDHIRGYWINVFKHRRGDAILAAARFAQRRRPLPSERGAALVFETNKYARRSYTAPPLTFGLSVIRVRDGVDAITTRELSSGGRQVPVRVIGSPGLNHDNVILEPYVRLLADELARWLRRDELA